VATEAARRVVETGEVVGAGSFICLECGFAVALAALDAVPSCPACDSSTFRRASLFEQPTLSEPAVEEDEADLGWLTEIRGELTGCFLAFEDDDGASVVPLPNGWSRIGRSITADIRLDDPTVSRRHAQIVRTEKDELRVIDDRSLNGVFVNGEQVEWSRLRDGDELVIGRYCLHVIATTSRSRLNPAAVEG
jgi:predicted  nucleic acid-binding Zn-ribbon protein